MPKTTVNKDYFPPSRKHQVRFPLKTRAVQTKTVAEPMHQGPYSHFRPSVLAADRPHIFAAIHSLNFERSHFNTCRCSSFPTRRTWDKSQMTVGFSVVIFLAP